MQKVLKSHFYSLFIHFSELKNVKMNVKDYLMFKRLFKLLTFVLTFVQNLNVCYRLFKKLVFVTVNVCSSEQ